MRKVFLVCTLAALIAVLITVGNLVAVQTSSTTDEFPGDVYIGDNNKLYFGAAPDVSLEWDADGTSQFRITGSTIFADAVEFDGGLSFDGAIGLGDNIALTYGDGSDWSCLYDETTDDNLECTAALGTSEWNVLVGNLTIGNGVATQPLNGEDCYVEGLFEADGVAYLDGGGIVADDRAFAFGAGSDWSCLYDETTDDNLECTAAAAAGEWNILVGNLTVGNGSPTVAVNGEDAYVEGTFEADGLAYLDTGGYIADDQLLYFGDLAEKASISYDATSKQLRIGASGAANAVVVQQGPLCVGPSAGPPDHLDGSGDLQVTDDFETDGIAYLDGGGIVADQQSIAFGTGSDWSCLYDETTDDNLECTAAAAASEWNILVGNLTVGNGSPTVAVNGEDGYIEGTFEADGMCYADGGATVATSLTLSYATASTPVILDASKNLVSTAFAVAAGADTACNTTCGTKTCLFGFDDGAADAETIVDCAGATADKCVCLGN